MKRNIVKYNAYQVSGMSSALINNQRHYFKPKKIGKKKQ